MNDDRLIAIGQFEELENHAGDSDGVKVGVVRVFGVGVVEYADFRGEIEGHGGVVLRVTDLIERNRLDMLGEIISTYESLLDEKVGVVRARVTSALELNSAQQSDVAAKLQALTGKKVRMQVAVDPALIGGFVAQVGSTIYDGSIRQQLP